MRKAINIMLIVTAITAMLILTVLCGSVLWAMLLEMLFYVLDKIVVTAHWVMHLIT